MRSLDGKLHWPKTNHWHLKTATAPGKSWQMTTSSFTMLVRFIFFLKCVLRILFTLELGQWNVQLSTTADWVVIPPGNLNNLCTNGTRWCKHYYMWLCRGDFCLFVFALVMSQFYQIVITTFEIPCNPIPSSGPPAWVMLAFKPHACVCRNLHNILFTNSWSCDSCTRIHNSLPQGRKWAHLTPWSVPRLALAVHLIGEVGPDRRRWSVWRLFAVASNMPVWKDSTANNTHADFCVN